MFSTKFASLEAARWKRASLVIYTGDPQGTVILPATSPATLLDSAAVTPFPLSTGGTVPRRRFQQGSVLQKSGRWYGVYRVDVLQADGTIKRQKTWQPLGLVSEQSERAARKAFQPYLDKVNAATIKLPPKTGLTLSEFVEKWRASVAVNLKATTTRAAESHLRAHIIPKLGGLTLTEIVTETVQGFVAYLANKNQ